MECICDQSDAMTENSSLYNYCYQAGLCVFTSTCFSGPPAVFVAEINYSGSAIEVFCTNNRTMPGATLTAAEVTLKRIIKEAGDKKTEL